MAGGQQVLAENLHLFVVGCLEFLSELLLLFLHMKWLTEVHLAFPCEAWRLNLGLSSATGPQFPKLKSVFMMLVG